MNIHLNTLSMPKKIIPLFLIGFSLLRFSATAQNVGIGTQTPSTTLQVFRDADVWHTSIGGNSGILLIGGQTTTPGFSGAAVIQATNPSSNTSNNLMFQRDGGNIAIGYIEPIAKLQVAGNVGINFQSDINIPQLTLTQTDASYSRIGFRNTFGKSFTLAALSTPSNGTDLFNVYSEKKHADLLQVTTAPESTVKVNGSLVLKTKYINLTDSSADIHFLDIGDASIVYLTGYLSTDINIWSINGITEGREIHLFNLTFNSSAARYIKLKHFYNLSLDNVDPGYWVDGFGFQQNNDNITLKEHAGCVLLGGIDSPGVENTLVWRCSSLYSF